MPYDNHIFTPMKNEIQFLGIDARLNVITLPSGLGILRELVLDCNTKQANAIITEATKRNIPFMKTETGVKLFQ